MYRRAFSFQIRFIQSGQREIHRLLAGYSIHNGIEDQEDRGDGSTPVPLDLGELASSDSNLTRVKLDAESSDQVKDEGKTEEVKVAQQASF